MDVVGSLILLGISIGWICIMGLGFLILLKISRIVINALFPPANKRWWK